MKLLTMQKIDKFFGPFICTLLTLVKKLSSILRVRIDFDMPKKIVILKFWGMGSIILSMPAIAEIKKVYPSSKIYFLSLGRNKELLDSYRNVIDETFLVDIDKGMIKFISNIISTILKIRKEKIDLFIDLEFFTRFSSILSYFSGAKDKAGFTAWEVWRGDLHNIKVPFNRYWHVKKNFENLISKAVKKDFGDLKLIPPKVIESINNDFLFKRSYICINPNSGELALQRRWPREYFIELSKKILNNFDIELIFIGSKSEREYVEDIVKEINSEKIKNLSGQLNFQELVFVLKNARLFITNDSGPLHLAVSLNTLTISFFGPETPVLYGPIGEKHIVFFKNIDCSPCINVHTGKIVKCYKDAPSCVSLITVEEVFDVVRDLLCKK